MGDFTRGDSKLWPRITTRRLMAAVVLAASLFAFARWLLSRTYVERTGVFITWELSRTRTYGEWLADYVRAALRRPAR